ncbi:sugar ABC transporter ATP-binding protein [Cryptosporangium aurantiacum]|uniref:Monosaccharide ABC transporter ATP-binding protein, CUT2 family n=1 Tax=Cryptosporangium aurantiacum TaxID=134849 RepID=A0A1M7QAT0_9ACTN|nr:sugar ABC transporter ATP-binding protein [Cryptosporangium aurantiacum]SHN27778.1 monosaccharide ABC transporter ATP-binding protein, CUT2 family [Cryptosporangium aurantiacum]
MSRADDPAVGGPAPIDAASGDPVAGEPEHAADGGPVPVDPPAAGAASATEPPVPVDAPPGGAVAEAEPVLELTGVSKAFGPVQALDDVSLRLHPGEVHCLAGENGAGKSTLIRVLTGAIRRDRGEYRIDGAEVTTATPAALRAVGVQAVYQELSLLPHLSVAENLYMGRLPARRGLLDSRRLRRRARQALDEVGLHTLDPDTPVEQLSAATKQLVEIAKVLTAESVKVIVFDEPTTALTEGESARLLDHIRRLRDQGVAMLYVTHRLEEMFEIGDRVTVLRDGGLSESGPMADYDENRLIAAMVGREVTSLYPEEHRESSDDDAPLLRVRGLRRTADGPSVDLDVSAGEIVGIGGLLGSGRSELLLAIFGAERIIGGEIQIDGRTVRPTGPRAMMNAGIGLLTEDRKVLGLLPELSIRENVTIASLRRASRGPLLPGKTQAADADRLLDSLRLRAGSYDQPVSTLSGGNQQKVLLARWLLTEPKVLAFDEPTKGIDVGAKGELYEVIGDLARRGLGIVVVSSYLPELIGLADRILVLRDGAIAGELPAGASEEDVLRLASGGAAPDEPEGERDGA